VLGSIGEVAKLKKAPHLKFLSKEGDVTVLVQATGKLPSALQSIAGFDVRELTTQQLNLEDEFLEFYGSAT